MNILLLSLILLFGISNCDNKLLRYDSSFQPMSFSVAAGQNSETYVFNSTNGTGILEVTYDDGTNNNSIAILLTNSVSSTEYVLTTSTTVTPVSLAYAMPQGTSTMTVVICGNLLTCTIVGPSNFSFSVTSSSPALSSFVRVSTLVTGGVQLSSKTANANPCASSSSASSSITSSGSATSSGSQSSSTAATSSGSTAATDNTVFIIIMVIVVAVVVAIVVTVAVLTTRPKKYAVLNGKV